MAKNKYKPCKSAHFLCCFFDSHFMTHRLDPRDCRYGDAILWMLYMSPKFPKPAAASVTLPYCRECWRTENERQLILSRGRGLPSPQCARDVSGRAKHHPELTGPGREAAVGLCLVGTVPLPEDKT